MAVQENPEFKQLEHNLSKIFQQDKAAKELEKLLKNNPVAYTSLTSQYFYGYNTSINLS